MIISIDTDQRLNPADVAILTLLLAADDSQDLETPQDPPEGDPQPATDAPQDLREIAANRAIELISSGKAEEVKTALAVFQADRVTSLADADLAEFTRLLSAASA